ncbi:glycoside hydrolase family 73 protein [Vagococcus carniphilus]|uniref:Glycoside hydrolase family 73 protein n=1 Tax=Vagococcus carniphilus TaxID=218144 RepID=A0AAW8U9C2_9ENTE|nr:glycoside hydrolase family 73 protein [Vagococcus carniphilus]MDT2813826.1 glycoside hydrolase family 73 protein [Vagococcus carniphilus]MDT2829828.1 glycoside hydrolase family 73 protein [Vagococcus carniphilus]MDT2834814.1 glycoside hydrolase family 73 protein [Vagococcus carniphilus]MDT2838262.1 glycoside hydrolase family 73 protein [Vagococcus carniphilus]MDT2850221.1 glycoside hydrolase family 73 protein [Vagococcus carniphilus]
MAKRRKMNYASPSTNKIPVIFSLAVILIGLLVVMSSLKKFTHTPDKGIVQEDIQVKNEEFIKTLVPVAKELHQSHGILPSIIIGQAILESDWGSSELSAKYNNLFGIKSFSPDDESVKLKTKEYKDGKWIEINANFKVYASWEDCMRDHTLLFVNGVDWDPYLYQGVLLASDYKTAAKALQAAGYATDPDYAAKIMSVIEKNELYQYDK